MAAIPALGLLVGCAIGLVVPDLPRPLATILLLGAAGTSVLPLRMERPRLGVALVGVAFAAGGSLLAADAWQQAWRPSLRVAFEELANAERARAAVDRRVLPEDDEAFATIAGVLQADASVSSSGVALRVDVTQLASRPVHGGLVVTVVGALGPARMDQWRAGRRVRMPVQLHRPARYLDAEVPDSEWGLARGGIALVGTVKSAGLVDVEALGSSWAEHTASLRFLIRQAIGRHVGRWSARSAAIVTAILIGDRTGLDDDVQRRLQEAGTYHVIAISGGNIAILAALLLGAFRLAGYLGRVAMLMAIVVLVAYANLVNGGASVSRATLMAVIYFGARACDQRSPPLNALWVATAALLLADPLVVADPGFILTSGATFGILLAQQSPQSSLSTHSTPSTKRQSFSAASAVSAVLVVVTSLFRASLAAEMMLFPVGAVVFSRVTFAGLGLNLFAIPMMAVAQIAGMVVVPAALISSQLASLAGWVAHVGAAGLIWSADLVRFVPMVTYRLAPPPWSAVAVYYVALGVWWMLRRRQAVVAGGEPRRPRQARRLSVVVAAGAAFWILVPPSLLLAPLGDGRLHVTFLDVGQGDSALLRFPNGAAMLVDAGGLSGSAGFDIGDRVVAPVLRGAGIRRLDYLVLTHGDPDHVGGAAAVIQEFRPREVWEGIPVPSSTSLASLRLEAQALGARWRQVTRGSRIMVNGVEVLVLHPSPADWERQQVRNDDSIALDVRWGDVSVVMTGDIGREAERNVGGEASPAPIRLLKVPHHGSLTSSSVEFLSAIKPTVAIVSAGRANHFGHPAPAVLERYRDAGIELFRTDQDGAVMVETDGSSLNIRTFTGRHLELSATTVHHETTKDTKTTKP